MGFEGSTEAEMDLKKIGVREKTPEVPTSAKPVGSKKEGPATLGCASASVGVCTSARVGAASYVATLKTLRSIRPWTASRKVMQSSVECLVARWKLQN